MLISLLFCLLLQTDPSDLKDWGSLGVGGLLAGVMFYFYRQDRKDSEARYAKIAEDFKQTIIESTRVTASVAEALRAFKGQAPSPQGHPTPVGSSPGPAAGG
jgi:hypothetical protein